MRRVLLALGLLISPSVAALLPQPSGPGLAEVDEIRVKRARLVLEEAQADFDRAQALLNDGLLSTADFQRKELALRAARLSYEEALLGTEGQRFRIRLMRALKAQRDRGKVVRVVLLAEPRPKEGNLVSDEVFEPLRVFLSVRDGEVIVGRPYEQAVDLREPSREAVAEFELLRDIEEATISWKRNGRVEEVRVVLEKDPGSHSVSLESDHFSQEADLGAEAAYDLRLEGFAADDRSYRLVTVGLPAEIRAEFVEPATKAKLSQVRFGAGSRARSLNLTLLLPRQTTTAVQVDQPILFWAVALDQASPEARTERLTEEQVRARQARGSFPGGVLALELLPRGLPELKVAVSQLFLEAQPGETYTIPVQLKNGGTRQLEGLRLAVDLPTRWRWRAQPPEVPLLGPGRETRVDLFLSVDPEALAGEQEVKLRFDRGVHSGRNEVDEKVVRVRVAPPFNPWSVVLLGGLLFAVVAGIFWITVRVGRK